MGSVTEGKNDADAFERFMKVVTGPLLSKASGPDPDAVRISELEREIRVMRRSLRRRKTRGGPA